MKHQVLFVAVVAVAAALSPQAPVAQAEDRLSGKVLLFAAASTTEAIERVRADFARLHPAVVVRVSYGASSTLTQQIIAGAEADVFLSAGVESVDLLREKHLVDKQHDLLSNQLAIITPLDSRIAISKPADLLQAKIRRIALADPRSVPAGIYARQALERLDLWKQLEPKVAGAADVRQALHFVETAAAEAGIVYVTDASTNKKVHIALRIESDPMKPIRYPLVLVKRPAGSAVGKALFEYLRSPSAADVFRAHGFIVLDQTPTGSN